MSDEAAPRPGRPSIYTPEIAELICKRLSEGESLRAICKADDMPSEGTVRDWARANVHGFSSQYTRARDLGLDALADQVLEIADGDDGDPANKRIRFDARRWYLSKLAPKRYGDRLEVENGGTVGVIVNVKQFTPKPDDADGG